MQHITLFVQTSNPTNAAGNTTLREEVQRLKAAMYSSKEGKCAVSSWHQHKMGAAQNTTFLSRAGCKPGGAFISIEIQTDENICPLKN